MSRELNPAYRFATEAQWQACHFVGADRRTAETRKGLRPFAPFALPATTLWDGTAFAPTIGDEAELIWRDDKLGLWTLPYAEEQATRTIAPAQIASATRLVAGPDALWAVGPEGTVQAFDNRSLTRLVQADLGDLFPIDIASDSGDGLYVLTMADCRVQIVHLGCAGNRDHALTLHEVRHASDLVFLGVPHSLAVLGSSRSKLHFIDARSGETIQTVQLSTLRGCFDVTAIGSDNCSRIFIAGTDGEATGGKHYVLIIDHEANLLWTVPVSEKVTGVAATRSQLFLTTEKGVVRLDPAATVPQGAGEIEARVVTPALQSPATGPQKWTRVEAKVELPAGCSIRISHACASDAEKRNKAEESLRNPALTNAQRLEGWARCVKRRTRTYHGASSRGGEITLSAPLHEVGEELVWIEVALIAAPGGRLPVLHELRVLYPGAMLIEHLPAIYRSGEFKPGDFTRMLIGVLEGGIQDLDEKIGKLGRKIHPKTADDAWLDYVASWLGLPWDNGLGVDQKRRLIGRTAALAEGYSTRSGLEELLECLLPGPPRRFRITDATADFGLATIAGRGCEGSRLPTILAGLPSTAVELGNKAILGKARLPCGEPKPDSARLVGHVRIDVAATAEERAAWWPWLKPIIESMLPAMVDARLRWLGPSVLNENRINENSKIVEEPSARLGSEAVTGRSRVGGRTRTTLPTKLTPNSTLQ